MAHLTAIQSIRFSFAYVKSLFVFSSPVAKQSRQVTRTYGQLPLPQLLPECFWLPAPFFFILDGTSL
jgi:hypothetical protein